MGAKAKEKEPISLMNVKFQKFNARIERFGFFTIISTQKHVFELLQSLSINFNRRLGYLHNIGEVHSLASTLSANWYIRVPCPLVVCRDRDWYTNDRLGYSPQADLENHCDIPVV